MLNKSLLFLFSILLLLCRTTLSRPLSETHEIIKTLHDIDSLMSTASNDDEDDDNEDRDENDDEDDDEIVNPTVKDTINNSTTNDNATTVSINSNNTNKTENVNVTTASENNSNNNNNVTNNSSTNTVNANNVDVKTAESDKKVGDNTKTADDKTSTATTRDGGIGPGQRLTSEQQIPPPPPPPEPPKTDVDFHKGDKDPENVHTDSVDQKVEGKDKASNQQTRDDEDDDDTTATKSDIDENQTDKNDTTEENEETSTDEKQESEENEEDNSSSPEQNEVNETEAANEQENYKEPEGDADKKEEIELESDKTGEENNEAEESSEKDDVAVQDQDDSAEENEPVVDTPESSVESNEVEQQDDDDKVKMFFISPFGKTQKNDNTLMTRQILTYPASGHGHTVNHHYGPSHIWNSEYPYFAYGYSWGCGHHGYGPRIGKKSDVKNKGKQKSDLICRDYVLLPAVSKASVITQNNEDEDQTGVTRQIVSKDIACNDNDPVCTQKQVIGSMAGGSLFGDGMGGLGMGFPGIPGLHTGVSGYNMGGGFGGHHQGVGNFGGEEDEGCCGDRLGAHGGGGGGAGGLGHGGYGLQGMHGGYHGHHGRDVLGTLNNQLFIHENTENSNAAKKATVNDKDSNADKRWHGIGGWGYRGTPSAFSSQPQGWGGWGAGAYQQGSHFGGWGKHFSDVGPIALPGSAEENYLDPAINGHPGVIRINGELGNPGRVDGAALIANGPVGPIPGGVVAGGVVGSGQVVGGPYPGGVAGDLLGTGPLVGHGRPLVSSELIGGTGIGYPYVLGNEGKPVAGGVGVNGMPLDGPLGPVSGGLHGVPELNGFPMSGFDGPVGPGVRHGAGLNAFSMNALVGQGSILHGRSHHGNVAIKSKIKSKKNDKAKKKTSVKGVTRQDIAMPDEQALMDVTKQRQLIGSLGASTLFSDNVGGMGLGHPGVPGMSSGISGIPGEYGGTGGYAHGWDGEGPGMHPHGYNSFGGYNIGRDEREYDQHERSKTERHPTEKYDESEKRELITKDDEKAEEEEDEEEETENDDRNEEEEETHQAVPSRETHSPETVPAQKMSEIRKLVHEVSDSLAKTNEKLKALKKHHTPKKEGDKRQITPAFTPVVAEPAAVPDIRYPVPSVDRYPLGAGYIWPSANYGHQYGGPYAWSKSHTPAKAEQRKEKQNKSKKSEKVKSTIKGKTKRSVPEKLHAEKSKTGTKRQFLEHPMGYGRRQYPYHGGMPIYGFGGGLGMPIHGGFGGGHYGSGYAGGYGHHRVLMEGGGRPFRISGGEFGTSHSLGGYGGAIGGGYGGGYGGHSLRPVHVISHGGLGVFPSSHGLSPGYGPEAGPIGGGIIGGHSGLIDGGYSGHPGVTHIGGSYGPGEAIYHGENTFAPTMGGVAYSHGGSLGGGVIDAPTGAPIEHTRNGYPASFSGYSGGGGLIAPFGAGRHSFGGIVGGGDIGAPVGGGVPVGAVSGGNIPGDIAGGAVGPEGAMGGAIGGAMGGPPGISGMAASSAVGGGYSGHSSGGFESENSGGGAAGIQGFGRQNIAQEEQSDPSQSSQYMGMGRSQLADQQMQSMVPEPQQAMFAPQQGMTPYGSDLRAMEYPGSKKSEVPKLKEKKEKKSN